MDNRYVKDDGYISKILSRHNINSNIIFDVIDLISNIRDSDKYEYLNMEYLAIAAYSLVTNNMQMDEIYLAELEKSIIKSHDHNTSHKSLIRYCRYIIKSHEVF